MYTPKDLKVALESLKECRVSSVLSENKVRPSKGKSSIACWTSKAIPEFCSQEALLIITAEAITLAETFATSGVDYSDVMATKQPSVINAWNTS